MAHDLVIRNATLVNGTGAPSRTGSVGIDGDTITEISNGNGDDVGAGTRTIDADGRLLTPGFVDIHTHLDAQIAWDPMATSSCWHGVTSAVMGNCGVTFAPVKPEDRGYFGALMESVEDIPAESIMEGLPWNWQTYGEYLDALDAMPKGVNMGGMVGHCAVRWWAMGERSLEEAPTADDLAAMVDIVDEAMAAGALGFSISRTLRHKVPDGRQVPGTWAELDELVALAEVLGRHERGFMGSSPRFDGEGPSEPRCRSELALLAEMSIASKRPLTFNLTDTRENPEHTRLARELAREANERGAQIRPQTTSRGIGVLFTIANMTPFGGDPAWQALGALSYQDRMAKLRDPFGRAELIGDGTAGPSLETLERFFVCTPETGARYEGNPADSLAAHAARRGTSPVETYVDLVLETDGQVVINWPILNHSFDAIADMLTDDLMLLGLADAGAHVGQILDASQPTWFLTYWLRERELCSLEEAIHRLTGDTAGFAGLHDRGTIEVGKKADLNLIDLEAMALPLPEFTWDFPKGAGRWIQRAEGYDATIVNGAVTLENGEHTGALAGTVLRSGPDLR